MVDDLKDRIDREIYKVYKNFSLKEVVDFFMTEKEAFNFKSDLIRTETNNIMKNAKVPILKQVAAANYIQPMLGDLISVNYKENFKYSNEVTIPKDLEYIRRTVDNYGVYFIRYKFKDGALIELDSTGKFVWKDLDVKLSKEQYEKDIQKAKKYLINGYNGNWIHIIMMQDKLHNYSGYVVKASTELKAKKLLADLKKSELKTSIYIKILNNN